MPRIVPQNGARIQTRRAIGYNGGMVQIIWDTGGDFTSEYVFIECDLERDAVEEFLNHPALRYGRKEGGVIGVSYNDILWTDKADVKHLSELVRPHHFYVGDLLQEPKPSSLWETANPDLLRYLLSYWKNVNWAAHDKDFWKRCDENTYKQFVCDCAARGIT